MALYKSCIISITIRVIQIIHRDVDLKCIFRLLPIKPIVSVLHIHISQRSVATLLMSGGIFINHTIADSPQNVPVKEF